MKHRNTALILFIMLVAASCSATTQVSGVLSDDAGADTASIADDDTAPAQEPATDEPQAVEDPTAVAANDDPAPTPTPIDEAAGSLDEADMADLVGPSSFGGELSPEEMRCVARGLLDDDSLAARIGSTDYEDLAIDDQTTIAVITFDCAPDSVAQAFSSSISDGQDAPFGPEVGSCLVDAMGPAADDRRAIIEGFAALGADQNVPQSSEAPVIDTMVRCFPADLFSEAIEAEVLANPAMAEAVDFDCIDQRFSGDATRPLWETVVRNPGVDFDQLDAGATEPMFTAIFACLSFGKVVAGQAAESGVILSDETIACIDIEMAEFDVAGLAASDQGSDEIGIAMAGCLTPEELLGLGG